MKTEELIQQVEGYTDVQSLQQRLNIARAKAIYLIHRLRKRGYVETYYSKDKRRNYYISRKNAIGGTSYAEILNEHVPIGLKIMQSEVHQIYGKNLTIEETLIYALKQRTVRHVLASLGLFRKISDWAALYKLAKKEGLVRIVAALHEISRLAVPKVRRMPQRFRNLALPKKGDPYLHIINPFSSDSFQNIEKKWKVYIPINGADLQDVKFEFALWRAHKKKRKQKLKNLGEKR